MFRSILFSLIIFTYTFTTQKIFAQNPKRASLEVMLSDESPMQIIINGRIYKQVNKKLIINDLPAKTNEIIILKKCNLAQNKNCKDVTVFSGNIKFEKGKQYQAVALVGEQKLRITDDGTLFNNNSSHNTSINNQSNSPSYSSTEFQKLAEIKNNLPIDLKELGEQLKKISSDNDRVETATDFISNRTQALSVEELWAISSWIMYDSNKLSLFKNSYPFIKDSENYHQLSLAFTMLEEKNEFEKFIQEKQ